MATKKVKNKLVGKRRSQAQKQPKAAALVDRIPNASRARKKSKKKSIAETKKANRKRMQAEIDFIKVVATHPELKDLVAALPKLELTLEQFLDAIKLEKFLTSDMNPKGTVFEILVLHDRLMKNILMQRGAGTLKSLSIVKNADLEKLVFNVAGKAIKKSGFGIGDVDLSATDTVGGTVPKSGRLDLATNFNTLHKNKSGKHYSLLFSDFAMVRYNPETGHVLIVIPGEIKEPAAAKELADQLAKIEDRLRGCEAITFDIGSQKEIKVSNDNVFVLKDNALGLPRRKVDPGTPRNGKNVTLSGDVLEIVQVNSRDTKAEVDPQEMFRFQVKVKPEYDPEKITKALIDIKVNRLKIPHKQ